MPQKESEKIRKPYPFRASPSEMDEIRLKAAAAGLPLGTYLREVALAHRIPGKSRKVVINELRRLGGLQKDLFQQGGGYAGGPFTAAYAWVLAELKAAIMRVENSSE